MLRECAYGSDWLVSFLEIGLKVNDFLKIMIVCIGPDDHQLWLVRMCKEAVGSKGYMIEEGNFFISIILDSAQLHSSHRTPNS